MPFMGHLRSGSGGFFDILNVKIEVIRSFDDVNLIILWLPDGFVVANFPSQQMVC